MTDIKLADNSDAFRFVSSVPMKMLDSGAIVPMTRWDRLRVRAIAAWEWLTRRRRSRLVVSEVDTEAGSVTLTSQRWSWLRWRWIDE